MKKKKKIQEFHFQTAEPERNNGNDARIDLKLWIVAPT